MQNDTLQNMLKKSIERGFPLVSISIATQISLEELQKILDNDKGHIISDVDKFSYLMVFLMQLNFEKPTDSTYYRNLLESLVNYFQVPLIAISKYSNVSINELINFENSSNKECIEKQIAHLFNTFTRNPRFSL